MSDTRVRALLLGTIVVMTVLPLVAASYFLNHALQTSLNLGFNPQISQALEIGSRSLKTLKNVDPTHQRQYREDFGTIENLQHVYSESTWVKDSILGSLEIYFGLGVAAAVVLSVIVATLLARNISRSYRVTFKDLLAQREKVRYMEEMSSWQELARVLAHEIKNPLTPIEVLVTSLGKSYRSKTGDEFGVQLSQTQAMISEELEHLKRTVNRFSDFAKLPQVHLVEANPAQVIAQHLPAIAASFETAEIRLQASAFADGLHARMDTALFRNVLMNIVRNAVEANPGRRVIFQLNVTSTEKWIEVALANDGDPVPTNLAARIFDPYVSGKNGKDNMGLGLAIVRKIILEHGGDITYAENQGHPRFTIALPRTN
jgi:signal transduction histidine kinase